ncbi:hypothetical protein H6G93_14035 [Nostoc sp. FACHB-973]|nr:hypothetical protein [Nostoc sp. FACHB-973]
MLEQIIKSDLLTELSTEEQQLLTGGYYGGDNYYTGYDDYGNAYHCYPVYYY